MAELMKGIEEVMATMPAEEESEAGGDGEVEDRTLGTGLGSVPPPGAGAGVGGGSVGMMRRTTSMSLSSFVMGNAEERRRSLGSSRRSSPEKKPVSR